MKHYELVLVFDASTTIDAIKKVRLEVESMMSVIDTDDIGMLSVVTKLHGHFTAYFLSYLISIDLAGINALKQYIRITKTIAKFHIFVINKDEEFIKYDIVKKQYEILALRDAPKKTKSTDKKAIEVIVDSSTDVDTPLVETNIIIVTE